jgi:hypothetical protein
MSHLHVVLVETEHGAQANGTKEYIMLRIVISLAYSTSLGNADFHKALGGTLGKILKYPGVRFGDTRQIQASPSMSKVEHVVYVSKEDESNCVAREVCWEALKYGWTVQLFTE